MFGRKNRCPVKGCKNRGTPAFLGVGICAEHAAERADAARAQWIDPATLDIGSYDSVPEYMVLNPGPLVPIPCGACGHPRWAHATPGMYDGPCIVPECTACDGIGDHMPGYVPGREIASR